MTGTAGGTEPVKPLKGVQKAAMLLILLGDQASGEILKHLSEDDVQYVAREIARIDRITPEQADTVLEEFFQITTARQYLLSGGIDYAQSVLVKAFGTDTARRLLERLRKGVSTDRANLEAIRKADPQQLANFLQSEHPQTIALVLAHLNSAQAAALLSCLPQSQRADLAFRLANLDQIAPDVVNKIATVIGRKLNALGEFSRESYGGVRAVAEMLNRLDSDTSKELLLQIQEQDAALVESLRHLMFVFDDLLTLDQNAIKEIMARLDRKVPMLALKGTSKQMKQHFLQCMSERGAQMLLEDMDALGAIKIKEVEAAQQEIVAMVRKLETEGVISLRGGGGDEYVV